MQLFFSTGTVGVSRNQVNIHPTVLSHELYILYVHVHMVDWPVLRLLTMLFLALGQCDCVEGIVKYWQLPLLSNTESSFSALVILAVSSGLIKIPLIYIHCTHKRGRCLYTVFQSVPIPSAIRSYGNDSNKETKCNWCFVALLCVLEICLNSASVHCMVPHSIAAFSMHFTAVTF